MNSMSVNDKNTAKRPVYCPICMRTVEAQIVVIRKRPIVKPGQRCAHCGSSLDAGFVFRFDRAA